MEKKFFMMTELLIVSGSILIIVVSLIKGGFYEAFAEALDHVMNDLTVELAVHAYIAGVVLIAIGVFGYYRKKRESA